MFSIDPMGEEDVPEFIDAILGGNVALLLGRSAAGDEACNARVEQSRCRETMKGSQTSRSTAGRLHSDKRMVQLSVRYFPARMCSSVKAASRARCTPLISLIQDGEGDGSARPRGLKESLTRFLAVEQVKQEDQGGRRRDLRLTALSAA